MRRLSNTFISGALTVLISALPAAASDYDFIHGPYHDPESPFVDVFASFWFIATGLTVGAACAVITLPADLYRQATTDDGYGYYTEKVCYVPAGGAGLGAYLIAGFPFWVLKKAFWDWPRSLGEAGDVADDPASPVPDVEPPAGEVRAAAQPGSSGYVDTPTRRPSGSRR